MDEAQIKRLHEVQEAVYGQIEEIERWLRETPNTPFGFKFQDRPDSPTFLFKRFTDEDYRAIEAMLPQNEEELAKQIKDETKQEQVRQRFAEYLEKYNLQGLTKDKWLLMDKRDLAGLFGAILDVSRRREENIEKFRPHQPIQSTS